MDVSFEVDQRPHLAHFQETLFSLKLIPSQFCGTWKEKLTLRLLWKVHPLELKQVSNPYSKASDFCWDPSSSCTLEPIRGGTIFTLTTERGGSDVIEAMSCLLEVPNILWAKGSTLALWSSSEEVNAFLLAGGLKCSVVVKHSENQPPSFLRPLRSPDTGPSLRTAFVPPQIRQTADVHRHQ